MFPTGDVEAFFRTTDAALRKTPHNEEVETQTFRGKMATRYETVEGDQAWRVRVTRGGQSVMFSPNEGKRLRAALEEAEIGKAWFRKLLEERDTPAESPLARPPVSDELYLTSKAGSVSLGDFSLQLEAARTFGPGYRTQYSIKFHGPGGGWASGDWVRQLVEDSESAIRKAKEGGNYESGANGDWSVVAKKGETSAKITVIPGKFFRNREPMTGEIDEEKLARIHELVEEAELRREWFEENEHLFMKPPR